MVVNEVEYAKIKVDRQIDVDISQGSLSWIRLKKGWMSRHW